VLEAKPAQNLSLFAQYLPYNLGGAFISSAGGGGNATAGFVNLRGLGRGATLVLLNSRRSVRYPVDQSATDIDALAPEIAVQGIEILKDGA
jgi:iron complex outermembrane receptor protein